MNVGSIPAVLVVSLAWLGGSDALAACEPLASRGSVIYGGSSRDKSKGAGVICDRQVLLRPKLASNSLKRSTDASQGTHRETDRESTRLILDSELSTTQKQLDALRAKGSGWSVVEQQAMHRLELDVQALQREIARHQSR